MKKILAFFLLLIGFAGLSGQVKFTDKRDGNIYRTITIAGVTWMAENLRYQTKNGAFYFDNDSNNIPEYGVLYEWETALSVCPDGWHLPTGNEFQNLINNLDQKVTWGKIASDPSSFGIQLGECRIMKEPFQRWMKAGITGLQQNMIRIMQNISVICLLMINL